MQNQRDTPDNPARPDNTQIPPQSQNWIQPRMDDLTRARLELISRMEMQLEDDRQRLLQQLDERFLNAQRQPSAVDSAVRLSESDVTYPLSNPPPTTSVSGYGTQYGENTFAAQAGLFQNLKTVTSSFDSQLLAYQPMLSASNINTDNNDSAPLLSIPAPMESSTMSSARRVLPPTLDFAGMVESLGLETGSFINIPPHKVVSAIPTSTAIPPPIPIHGNQNTNTLIATSIASMSNLPVLPGDQALIFGPSIGLPYTTVSAPPPLQTQRATDMEFVGTSGVQGMGHFDPAVHAATQSMRSRVTNPSFVQTSIEYSWIPRLDNRIPLHSNDSLGVPGSSGETLPLFNMQGFPFRASGAETGGFPTRQFGTACPTSTQPSSGSSENDPRKKPRRKRENSNQLGIDTSEVMELGSDTRVHLGSGLRIGPSTLDNLPNLPPESKLNNLLQLFLTGEGSSLVPIFNSRHFHKIKLPPFVLLSLQTLAARFTGDRNDVSLGSKVLLVRAKQDMLPILMESAHRSRDGWSTTDSSRSSSSNSPEESTTDPSNPSGVSRMRSPSDYGYPAELFALSGMVHVLYYLSMSSDPSERSLGKNWLALAVVTAKELGLNNEPQDESSLSWAELSMRRRIWWALWTIDNCSPLRNRSNNSLASMKESNVRVLTDDSFWLMTPTEERPPEDRMPPFMSDVNVIFEAHVQFEGDESEEYNEESSGEERGSSRKESRWHKKLIKRPFLDDSNDGLEVPGIPVDASESYLHSVLYGCQRKIHSLSKRRQAPFAAIAQKLTIARPFNVRIGIVVTVLENGEEMSRQISTLRLEPWLPIFNKKWSLLDRRGTKDMRDRASTAESTMSEIVPYSGNPEDYLRRAPTQNPQVMHQAFIFKNKKAAEFMRKQRNLLRLFRMVDAQFHVVGDGSAATGGRQFGLFRLIHYHHAWVVLHTPIMIVEQFVRFVTGLPTQEPDDPRVEPRPPKQFPEPDLGILSRWASSDYGGVLSCRHAMRISAILGEMWGDRPSESALSVVHPSRGSGTPYVDQTSGFLGVLCLYFYICGCVLVVCHGYFDQNEEGDVIMVDREAGTVGRVLSHKVRDSIGIILRVLRGTSKNWAICEIYSDSLHALMDGAENSPR
ncbi:hypothetical protein BJ742DRAFT_858873 [Cladochytrium replicatum]|nr:hypothetical protein BJ742DRAFT_858873 [Cladochytrium replicatum]